MATEATTEPPASAAHLACANFLLSPLSRVLAPESLAWLNAEIDRQRTAADERRLAIALGLASRKIGRVELSLTADEAVTAQRSSRGLAAGSVGCR